MAPRIWGTFQVAEFVLLFTFSLGNVHEAAEESPVGQERAAAQGAIIPTCLYLEFSLVFHLSKVRTDRKKPKRFFAYFGSFRQFEVAVTVIQCLQLIANYR
nr:hypothetical transcript [Hymenolepis microstoma]